MGRLAVRQVLRVPKYLGEMLILRSQDQLTAPDAKSTSRYGSPFELNLQNWSRSSLSPTLRNLVEGPPPVETDATKSGTKSGSRLARVDFRRARRRAKLFMHITTMTGGLFSNWKQVSKTVGVYRDFLANRMDYELSSQPSCPVGEDFVPNNDVQRRALEKLRAKAQTRPEGVLVHDDSGSSRLMKVHKRLHGVIDETKEISKGRFVRMNAVLERFPLV